MKKKYTKKQIQEAINYWTKQLKLGNYKKVLKEEAQPNNKSIIFGLATSDYGGGSREEIELDNIEDAKIDGLDFLMDQFEDWMNASYDSYPEDYEKLYKKDFERIANRAFLSKAISILTSNFKKSGKEETYELGELDGNSGTWIYIEYDE